MNTAKSQNPISDDQEDALEVFRLLDEVCENGDAALPQLESYLESTQDGTGSAEIDVESSLAKFKADHAAFFTKPHRVRRWGYRVCVAVATVVIANTVCAFALGHSLFDYVAKWSAETFGFYHNDFATSEDGKIIYYPDGTWEDRSAMPDYDHKTYTALPEKNTAADYDPSAPIGSEENPQPIENQIDSDYADLLDTDLSGTGLQKTASTWNDSHMVESFDISNADLKCALSGLGITSRIAPSSIPDGYSLRQINVIKNYFTNGMDILADYSNNADSIIVAVSKRTDYGNGIFEKDDRSVIVYNEGGDDWYIMHNLQRLNAVSMINDYEVCISGDISVDEMKDIIDSIYK